MLERYIDDENRPPYAAVALEATVSRRATRYTANNVTRLTIGPSGVTSDCALLQIRGERKTNFYFDRNIVFDILSRVGMEN